MNNRLEVHAAGGVRVRVRVRESQKANEERTYCTERRAKSHAATIRKAKSHVPHGAGALPTQGAEEREKNLEERSLIILTTSIGGCGLAVAEPPEQEEESV